MKKLLFSMLMFVVAMLSFSSASMADGLFAKTDQINQFSLFKPMASVVATESVSDIALKVSNKSISDKTVISNAGFKLDKHRASFYSGEYRSVSRSAGKCGASPISLRRLLNPV